MKSEKILEAFGDIPDEMICEAAPNPKRKGIKKVWIRWSAAAAACLAVALIACSSPLIHYDNPADSHKGSNIIVSPKSSMPASDRIGIPGSGSAQNRVAQGSSGGENSAKSGGPSANNPVALNGNSAGGGDSGKNVSSGQSAAAPQTVTSNQGDAAAAQTAGTAQNGTEVINASSVKINELENAPAFTASMFALNVKDFNPMSDEKLLEYYGVSLKINEALPMLIGQARASGAVGGIYKNDSRGIYFDNNTFTFANADGSQTLKIVLAKNHLPFTDMRQSVNQDLQESTIGGVGVMLAHYTTGGNSTYYAQFMHDGIGYSAFAGNMSQADFIKAVMSLVS